MTYEEQVESLISFTGYTRAFCERLLEAVGLEKPKPKITRIFGDEVKVRRESSVNNNIAFDSAEVSWVVDRENAARLVEAIQELL